MSWRVLHAPEDDPALLRATYDTVLRPSFVRDELPSFDALVGGFADRWTQAVVVAVDPAGTPLAAGVTGHEHGSPVALLSYLAVRPDARSAGLGRALLAQLGKVWRSQPVELVLAEIHDPRAHEETDDERPTARLRFYADAGAALLDLPWVQPALSPATSPVPGMLLVVLHPAAETRPAAVPTATIRAWATTYYTACGAPMPGPFEARLQARSTIGLLPLRSYELVEPLSSTSGGSDA